MTFSFGTKQELCKIENKFDCCERAECYALLLFSKLLQSDGKELLLENGAVARRIAELAAACTGVIPEVTVNLRRRGYLLTIPGEVQRQEMRSCFKGQGPGPVQQAFLAKPCCSQAFVRGAFIACGSVSDPAKRYHLEFVVQDVELAETLGLILRELPLSLQPGVVQRQGSWVVYMKGSGQIEDFLTYTGATNASMSLMQTKMYKEALNNINRQSNFETANIDKTYSASARQTAAIAVISDTKGLNILEEDLRRVAELRLHNPEMTLKEMSEALGMSRSGVNHKMQKLLKLSGEIMEHASYSGLTVEKNQG